MEEGAIMEGLSCYFGRHGFNFSVRSTLAASLEVAGGIDNELICVNQINDRWDKNRLEMNKRGREVVGFVFHMSSFGWATRTV
jgi:hypothetical protein